MSRVLILLLRFVLLFALIYYFIKLLGRWLASGTRSTTVKGEKTGKTERRYSELTNQVIEDADFEEISEEDEP